VEAGSPSEKMRQNWVRDLTAKPKATFAEDAPGESFDIGETDSGVAASRRRPLRIMIEYLTRASCVSVFREL
jgi:hypothetical protein